ncbi:hypothetical protein C3943_03640 [Lysinibacillus sp. B2A1]|nr:hypothetical protein C3943_03640 [Lysinibacillus sp. B2A1]
MWKMSFITILFATLFLGGCNWGNRAVEDRPVENAGNDVRRGVDKVEDTLDPDRRNDVYDRNVNGVERGTVNENRTIPEATTPGTNADLNGTNGYDNVPNANGVERNDNVIKENVVEEKVDVHERNNMNTR